MSVATVRQHLDQLRPPSPALDLATPGSGLGDAAAHESVARLITRQCHPRGCATRATEPGQYT